MGKGEKPEGDHPGLSGFGGGWSVAAVRGDGLTGACQRILGIPVFRERSDEPLPRGARAPQTGHEDVREADA